MALQQSARAPAGNLGNMLNDIDRVTEDDRRRQGEHGLRQQEVHPPSYGGPQRDAINSVVDGIVGDICSKIGDLRKTLDAIEQAVLQSAAKSKHTLNEHVSTCVRINDEVVHMREVVAELAEQAREA
jgi:hypothetical protein